jgi:hypothetical protein
MQFVTLNAMNPTGCYYMMVYNDLVYIFGPSAPSRNKTKMHQFVLFSDKLFVKSKNVVPVDNW